MRRQMWWVVAALVSFMILLATLGVSVLAWRTDPKTSVTSTTTTEAKTRPPGTRLQSDVRVFPLHSDPSPLARGVTPESVGEALSILAAQLRIVSDVGVLSRSTIEQYTRESDVVPYPYAYPGLDSIIAAQLDPSVIVDRPELVLDFVAVAETAAANAKQRSGFEDFEGSGAVAYSVLRQAVAIAPRCDLQLQLLHLVTLGDGARDASITAEVDRAQQLCLDDPTPLWLRAQDRAHRAFAPFVVSDLTKPQLISGAFEDLETLQRTFPRSPLGFAGAADLLLDRSDDNEARGMRPFQVREWRRAALELSVKARSLSEDPGLLIGHARALSGLGRHEEALAVLAPAGARTDRLSAVLTAQVRARQAAGDFRGVLDLLSGPVTFPDGSQVSNSSARLTGYGRLTALPTFLWDATYQNQGGADTQDVAFIPQSRGRYTTDGSCLEQAGRNALLLLGSAEAPTWDPSEFSSPPNDRGESPCADLLNVPTDSEDAAQDLYRWAGDLPGAQRVIDDWIVAKPNSYLAHQRAGEVAYLSGAWDAAQAQFSAALTHWRSGDVDKDSTAWQLDAVFPDSVLSLQLAASQQAGGDAGAARRTLVDLVTKLDQPDPETGSSRGDEGAARFYAESQLGAAALAHADDREAVDHLSKAVALAEERRGEGDSSAGNAEGDDISVVLLRGAQESNLALALARIGRYDEAIRAAQAAVRRDPANPVFLDTLAFAYDLSGDAAAAVPAYQEVLAADESSYVSANNLAVLLARSGDLGSARTLLLRVVSTAPSYSVGWHNLGVTESKQGVTHLLSAQRALAQAARLDPSLRGAAAEFLVDDTIYSSGLDISKSLSPTWNYASSATSSSNYFLISIIILVAVRAGWSLGVDRLFEQAALRVLGTNRSQGLWARLLGLRTGLLVALAASTVLLAIGPVRQAATVGDAVLDVVIISAVVWLPIALRQVLMSRDGVVGRHEGSVPAIGIGLGAIALGLSLAPYPGLADDREPHRRRVVWVTALAVAVVAVAFATITFFSAVPLARLVTLTALALIASIMLPVRPFDGARLKSRWVGLAVSAGSIGVAVAVSAQLI